MRAACLGDQTCAVLATTDVFGANTCSGQVGGGRAGWGAACAVSPLPVACHRGRSKITPPSRPPVLLPQPALLAVQATCASPTAWGAISPAAAVPPARAFASLAPSPDGTTAYLFGGQIASGAVVNDVYALSSGAGFADAQAGTAELTNLATPTGPARAWMWPDAFNGSTATLALTPTTAYANAQGALLCAVTSAAPGPWWAVDLGSSQAISSVTVWQAPTSAVAAGSLAGFRIYVGQTNSSWDDPSNVVCPQPFPDFYTTSVTVPCVTTGRYVWVVLPSASGSRQLSLCGVQVWQRTPWAWRALTQTVQVATLAPVTTPNGWYGSYLPRFAVDGIIGNNMQATVPSTGTTSCFHSPIGTPAVSPSITIDLGDVYDVSQVVLWPRTDCCANPRNFYWQMFIGNSRNTRFNTQCAMPTDVTPSPTGPTSPGYGPTYTNFNKTINCPARGRYVTITRPYRAADADGTTNNYMGLCEVKVFASSIVGLPTPRAGHAATTFKGQMVVAGGYDNSGNALGDIALFDLQSLVWTAIGSTTGTAPAARYYAAVLPVRANSLAYFGGFSGAGLSDLNLLNFPACPTYSTTNTALACYAAGSSCSVTCSGGYTLTDASTLTCGPTGAFYSATPPCTGPLLPAISAAPSFAVIDSQSVQLTWPALTGSNPGITAAQYIRYLVQTTPSLYLLSSFSAGVTPSDWLNFAFMDNTLQQFVGFQNGQIVISSAAGADCWTGSTATAPSAANMLCAVAHRAIPANITRSAFFVEGYAYLDNSLNPTQCSTLSGITICELFVLSVCCKPGFCHFPPMRCPQTTRGTTTLHFTSP